MKHILVILVLLFSACESKKSVDSTSPIENRDIAVTIQTNCTIQLDQSIGGKYGFFFNTLYSGTYQYDYTLPVGHEIELVVYNDMQGGIVIVTLTNNSEVFRLETLTGYSQITITEVIQ